MIDSIHLLYAEDNTQDADLTRIHFARSDSDIHLEIITTGVRCLERLTEQPFDILLLDNRLPDMDGVDVLARLRAEGHVLPVVLVTGTGDEDVVAQALRAGATDYVSKSDPNYLATLPDLVRSQVMRHRQHLLSDNGGQRKWRILYIEPNAMDVELTVRHVAADAPHLQLHTVSSSREALVLLASEHHFDLVLSDLRVPDMSALELMGEMQHRGIKLPVIVITGKGDEASAVAILRLGAYDYIVKRDNYLPHLPHAIDHALHRFHLDQTTRRLNAELAALNASLEHKVEARTAQLRQEMELRHASENSYRHLIETTHELVQSVGSDGKFTFVNNSWCAALGWSRDEALQLSFNQVIKPDQLAHCQDLFSELKQGKNFNHIEVTFVARDGHEIMLEGNLSSIIVDGAFAGTQSFFRDITERKRTENLLRESEDLFRATFEQAAVGIAHVAPDGHWLRVNQKLCDIVGYTREELLTLTFQEITLSDDLDPDLSYVRQMLAGKISTYSMEKRYVRKQGDPVWINLTVALVRHADDSPNYFISVVEDISARKITEDTLRKTEARAQLVLDFAMDAVISINQDGRVISWNREAERMFGYAADHALGKEFSELIIPPDLRKAHKQEMQRFVQTGKSTIIGKHIEMIGIHADGSEIPVEITIAAAHMNGDYFFNAFVRDITERKKAQAQLMLAAKVFEQSSEAFLVTDATANIVMVNHAFTAMTGYTEAEVLGKNPRILSSGHQSEHFYRAMWESIITHGLWHGELLDRRKDGSLYPKWLSISRLLDEQGKVTHYIGIFNDISQRKQYEQRIQQLAHFDSLTGLPNRILLNDRISQAISSVQRSNSPLAVLFLDLDHFKNVNDNLGHRIGDLLLIEIASRLKSVVRDEDTVSRLGGDEFILVLPGSDADGAAHVAGKLIEVVTQHFLAEQYDLIVTPSIGIAMYPNDGKDFETLYKCADVAMYRAKHEGRNKFRFYTSEMQARSARNLQLENAMRHALELGQFQLHYQPQVLIDGGRVIGVEALLRWQHPDFGNIAPAEFIQIAEDSGQILKIGEWVLRTAAQQLKSWMDSGMAQIVMAVNLSAVQFRHANLPDMITKILHTTQLSPQYLELELTESVAMDDPLGAIAVMNNLHQRGIRMSIDDFGTGYSSLNYLKRFQVYKLKIDQSFVHDITDDPEDRAIVSAIIRLSEAIGLKTIAEGVETEEQLAFLRAQGCHEAQGFHFSKPLPADQFEMLMRQQS